MEFLKYKIKIKLLTSTAQVPQKATAHAAGYDLSSDEDYLLKSQKYGAVSTGIAIELPSFMEAQVRPRSGLALKNGITLLNAPGTIDADYRGEIKVILINHSNEDFFIKKGMRIAQIIFAKVESTEWEITEKLKETQRGSGGFGSTGITSF